MREAIKTGDSVHATFADSPLRTHSGLSNDRSGLPVAAKTVSSQRLRARCLPLYRAQQLSRNKEVHCARRQLILTEGLSGIVPDKRNARLGAYTAIMCKVSASSDSGIAIKSGDRIGIRGPQIGMAMTGYFTITE